MKAYSPSDKCLAFPSPTYPRFRRAAAAAAAAARAAAVRAVAALPAPQLRPAFVAAAPHQFSCVATQPSGKRRDCSLTHSEKEKMKSA